MLLPSLLWYNLFNKNKNIYTMMLSAIILLTLIVRLDESRFAIHEIVCLDHHVMMDMESVCDICTTVDQDRFQTFGS